LNCNWDACRPKEGGRGSRGQKKEADVPIESQFNKGGKSEEKGIHAAASIEFSIG